MIARRLLLVLGVLLLTVRLTGATALADAKWVPRTSMPTARDSLAAAVDPDGRIYAIGGYNSSGELATAEAYTPSTDTWTTVASMPTARAGLAAVTGPDGRIYAIGGETSVPAVASGLLATVEAYDPSTNTWTKVASMPTARDGLAAVASPDGRIYAVGGQNSSGPLATVEAYTPSTDTWTKVASMPTARDGLAAAVSPDGRIYAVGGESLASSGYLVTVATVEAYTPSTNTWTTAASMSAARHSLAAAVDPDGRIYAIGGANSRGDLATVEAYVLGTNTWTTVASMPTDRDALATVAGPDGRIYAIGGENYSGALATVEAYTPSTDTWTTVASMPTARDFLAAAVGYDGRIYAIGGKDSWGPFATVEAYAPSTNTWTKVASMPTARDGLAAVAGPDGRIYAIGGYNSSGELATVEAYDPSTDTWTKVTSMPTARDSLAAVAGPDGRIYAIGGEDSWGPFATVEAYAPSTDTWTKVASMPTDRDVLAAAVGPDGRIYAIGGKDYSTTLATVEAYAPSTDTWTTVASMPTARGFLAAVAGPDGRIYAIGGENNSGLLATAEAYGFQESPIVSRITDCPTTQAALNTDIGNAPKTTVTFNCTSPTTIHFDSAQGGTGSPTTINQNVTLDGSNSAPVTFDGGNSTQLFSVNSGWSLNLKELTLSHGHVGTGSNGGAISNAGTLSITNSTLTGNSTNGNYGGAIYNTGTLSITSSTLSGNSTSCGNYGGAIYNAGTLSITSSTLSGNASGTLSSSCSGSGGAIENAGTVHITTSTLSGNVATYGGGAINNDSSESSATITGSTLSSNSSGDGGAIYNDGTLSITNGTLSGNAASNFGGGAVYNYGTVHLTSSTLSSNSGPSGGAIYNVGTFGGTVTIGGSIIAGSTSGGNCSGGVTDSGYNLEWSGTGQSDTCGFSSTKGDITGQDPKFDSAGLAGNGSSGPQTIALQQGSPAIDVIPTAQCATSDERGITRPDSDESNCDIGAYEYDGPDGPTTASTTLTVGTASGNYGGAATLTATLTSGGSPVIGKTITFSLNGAVVGTATTADGSNGTTQGVATLTGVRLGTISPSTYPSSGSCNATAASDGVFASFAGDNSAYTSSSGCNTLTVSKADQTITFGTLANHTYGDQPFSIRAIASSIQPVSFTASGPCTVAQNTSTGVWGVTITGAGTGANGCTITASQGGNSNYNQAPSVSQSFDIAPASLTITASSPSVTYTGSVPPITPSYTGFIPGESATNLTNRPTCGSTAPTSGAAGTYVTSCSDAVDPNYQISYIPGSLTIAKAQTSTSLSSSLNPSMVKGAVTFTAILSVTAPGAGTPTGTADFFDGTTKLGSGPLTTSNGVTKATFSTGALAQGSHSVTVTYNGDGNFVGSTSVALAQNVDTNLSGYPTLSSGAPNLSNTTLSGAYLVLANLTGANAGNATLTNANLTSANLSGANLSQANLSGAIMSKANLTNANLSQANLKGVTGLGTATLTGVIWSKTTCPDGTLSNKDGGTCAGHL